MLASWFPASQGEPWRPHELTNDRLDLAVARGAAYYGMVRRGVGVRIAAGLARTYYIGAETAGAEPTAVCLLPAEIEAGQEVDLADRTFELLIRHPVEFPLYVSSTRLTDRPGELLSVDPEQMTSLPPIRTVLESQKKGPRESLAVNLHARLTEIGTLDLWCSEAQGPRTWRLQFDVRAATQTDRSGHLGAGEAEGVVDESLVADCRTLIQAAFSPSAAQEAIKPESLVKRLEARTELRRRDWPMSLLRSFWEALVEVEPGRRRSAEHEARWLYLFGFSLRPGYGLAVDDWRVAQTWRLLQGKRAHHTPACRVEWLILWRRIAGGLAAGQQRSLAEPLIALLRPVLGSSQRAKSRKPEFAAGSHEAAEVWRLLGSLELLSVSGKIELAEALLLLVRREKVSAVRDAGIWRSAGWCSRADVRAAQRRRARRAGREVDGGIDRFEIAARRAGLLHRADDPADGRPLPRYFRFASRPRAGLARPARRPGPLSRAGGRRRPVAGRRARPDVRRKPAPRFADQHPVGWALPTTEFMVGNAHPTALSLCDHSPLFRCGLTALC